MRSVELFVGAGGLGLGLHAAGFRPERVVEWDRYCCDTIRDNQSRNVPGLRDWSLFEGDVKQVDFRPLQGKVALVSGGPPCQPFSIGGKHKAHADSRDMFPEAVRAVREARPKAFIFENVKGLTRGGFRNYFEYIRLQLQYPDLVAFGGEDWSSHHSRLEVRHTSAKRTRLQYRVVSRVLNAANFGVPQRRERVFFVGFRADLGIQWAFPEETHSLDALLWDQKFGDYWERHCVPRRLRQINPRHHARVERASRQEPPITKPWRTVRDAIHDLPDPERNPDRARECHNHRFQGGARSYVGHTGSPMDEPAKTLKAGVHGVPGGENMLLRPDGSVRYFTVRESARLQTFPDDFRFNGSWSEAMRQLGNAVPVELAKCVGRAIGARLAE